MIFEIFTTRFSKGNDIFLTEQIVEVLWSILFSILATMVFPYTNGMKSVLTSFWSR